MITLHPQLGFLNINNPINTNISFLAESQSGAAPPAPSSPLLFDGHMPEMRSVGASGFRYLHLLLCMKYIIQHPTLSLEIAYVF